MSTAKILAFRRPERPTDVVLLRACAEGDRAALGELFDRHAESLTAFLTRLTGVREHEVDDLVQETFLAVFRSAASYADGASVKTWLFAVGANVARDRVRKASRLSLLRARFARWQSGVESRGPERLMQQTEAVRALAAAMAELPADLRTAFVMCDVEQLPGVEVAAALELPTGTQATWVAGSPTTWVK